MSSYSGETRSLVVAVLAELRELATEIDRLDERAAARFGVSRTDLRCLELLGAAGAMAPTELAAAVGFTTGGMTTVIDRLERAGYVRRRPDSHDRRKVIVEATARLADRERAIFGELLQTSQELIASYSDAELETIRSFLARTRTVIGARGNGS